MEMERPNTVWTRCGGRNCVGDFGACRVKLKGGVVVQNKPEFWYHLLATSFVVGFVLGYGVTTYVAITLGR